MAEESRGLNWVRAPQEGRGELGGTMGAPGGSKRSTLLTARELRYIAPSSPLQMVLSSPLRMVLRFTLHIVLSSPLHDLDPRGTK